MKFTLITLHYCNYLPAKVLKYHHARNNIIKINTDFRS